jgi:hypothetical protein
MNFLSVVGSDFGRLRGSVLAQPLGDRAALAIVLAGGFRWKAGPRVAGADEGKCAFCSCVVSGPDHFWWECQITEDAWVVSLAEGGVVPGADVAFRTCGHIPGTNVDRE